MKKSGARSPQKNCVRSNLLPTLDQKRYQSVKFNKLLSKRQLQGMIKQRETTRATIFRLANTSLHQVYYEDHEITEYLSRYLSRYAVLLWEMMEVMMLMHGSMLPATTNPPPLPPFRSWGFLLRRPWPTSSPAKMQGCETAAK